MSKPLIYLSGPMAGLSGDEANGWRVEFALLMQDLGADVTDVTCLSPMRGKDLAREAVIQRAYDDPLRNARAIVTRDRWDVMRCAVMVVNLLGADTISIGTVAEMAWADAYRKPVVLVMEADNPHEHPMVTELAGFRVETLEDAATVVRGLLP